MFIRNIGSRQPKRLELLALRNYLHIAGLQHDVIEIQADQFSGLIPFGSLGIRLETGRRGSPLGT